MVNYTSKLEGSMLTIVVDISKNAGMSKSGKSLLIATSNGNVAIEGTDLMMGLNIYRPIRKEMA